LEHEVARASTTAGLPVAPTLSPSLEAAGVGRGSTLVDRRSLLICLLALPIGLAAGLVARLLTALIYAVTNLSFYGRLSFSFATPWENALGLGVIVIPVIGGLIVGVMARYGSAAIRGHGIPEAMEQVLLNESRIPPRITFLKPVSAAIAIGTGGPFGAEGPIIATGGAMGSVLGQVVRVTAKERKTLLAAGAAAGMAATFGSPISAVLLAVELLLFELRPASVVPVAFASAVAAGVRTLWYDAQPIFAMPAVAPPGMEALASYAVVGAVAGLASVGLTRAVYAMEDAFDLLPVHWMWWPAIGALAVGVVGYFVPRTLGVGYENISDILSAKLALGAVITLCAFKFVSWCIALSSGTSGGTLAPIFTIGGGLGAALGAGAALLLPHAGIDPRVAGVVGMAALFAGASRAFLASVVFAFETTHQVHVLLPLLAGGAAAYLVSALLMRNTIMTEKIARRGVRVPEEYQADYLDGVLVRDGHSRSVVSLRADDPVDVVRSWLASDAPGTRHQGFPVLDAAGELAGVITAREIAMAPDPAAPVRSLLKRAPVVVFEDESLREATDRMVEADVGRLPVVKRGAPRHVIGMITRSDVVGAHRRRLREERLD
jgi:H+/Cl- antiporter ClcA